MSSYHHVKNGMNYPAVLLQHGVNDAHVNVGQSNKMAARLLAASTSCKPVLLDLEYEGGHGAGTTKLRRQKQLANLYAFLLQQAPGFGDRRKAMLEDIGASGVPGRQGGVVLARSALLAWRTLRLEPSPDQQ